MAGVRVWVRSAPGRGRGPGCRAVSHRCSDRTDVRPLRAVGSPPRYRPTAPGAERTHTLRKLLTGILLRMPKRSFALTVAGLLIALTSSLFALDSEPGFAQTQADAYTRYELLEPSSQSFRIIYDVTATAPGAAHYFNPIRVGSTPTVHGVTDHASGKPLEWALVEAADAVAAGLRNWGHEGRFHSGDSRAPGTSGRRGSHSASTRRTRTPPAIRMTATRSSSNARSASNATRSFFLRGTS